MLSSKGRKKKGKLDDISALKELNDGQMQNERKLYGKDPGPITETRLMHGKRHAKHLDGPTPPTKLYINLFYLIFFFFILFFFIYLFLFLFIYFVFELEKKFFFHIFIA